MSACQKKKISLMLFCLILTFFVGCGGGGGGGDKPNETQLNMEGVWEGATTWEDGDEWPMDLTLYQEKDTIVEGELVFNSESDNPATFRDVTGTVKGTTAEISAVKIGNNGSVFEVVFTGNFSGRSCSGETILYQDGSSLAGGTFTMTPNGNDDPDVPDDTELTEVPLASCFTLATGTYEPGNCSDTGDMYLYDMDNRADIGPAGYEDQFCPQEGTFSDLESVPEDYSDCQWTAGIEGYDSENRGYIVRDASLTHHYKMRIVKNQGVTLSFEYEQID
jgi:hypothetical protein